MEHSCSVCGKAFETSRSHARYCSSTCRGRALRTRKASGAEVVPLKTRAASPPEQPGEDQLDLISVVTHQLSTAGKLGTYAGQQALVVARRLDRSAIDTGSAVAALSKELDRLMSSALADVKAEPDLLDGLVDEVSQMRTRRRG